MSISLFSATLAQIGLPPWQFSASQRPACKDLPGYYSKEAVESRRQNREKARAFFQEKGPSYPEEIAVHLGIERAAACAVIAGMVKSKTVERLDDGRYQITEAKDA